MASVAQSKTEAPLILAFDAESSAVHASLNAGTAKLIIDLGFNTNFQPVLTPDGGVEPDPDEKLQSIYQSNDLALPAFTY